MEKMQEKGEIAEEELRALEEDVTGRVNDFLVADSEFLLTIPQIMLASWRGARLEVVQVLRTVIIPIPAVIRSPIRFPGSRQCAEGSGSLRRCLV